MNWELLIAHPKFVGHPPHISLLSARTIYFYYAQSIGMLATQHFMNPAAGQATATEMDPGADV